MSATKNHSKSPTDSTKSNKDNKDKKDKKDNKNSEDKKNSKVSSQNSSSSSVKKVKKPSRFQATVLRIRKAVFFIKQFFKTEQKNDVQPTTQDKYKTDPVPSGKPKPVEPQEQETRIQTFIVPLQ